MKKFTSIVLSLMMALSLSACSSSSKKDDTLNVLCPTGAPSLSMVSVYDDVTKEGKIDFVNGTDQLQAELVKEDGDYNVIVAPINLGAKLLSAGKCQYQLVGVLTWGNLYLVGTDESDLEGDGEIALFGEGAVPQMIYNRTVASTVKLTAKYYTQATDVQAQLISGKVKAGMLAEPLATATIAKAKQNGTELKIIKDLQEVYGENGYPQAAIFAKEGTNMSTFLSSLDTFTNNGYEGLKEGIENVGVDTLGLPSVDIAVNTIERQNLHYKSATECLDEINTFLKPMDIELTEDNLF